MTNTTDNILEFKGSVQGHKDWVTALAHTITVEGKEILVSASRDKKVVVWGLNRGRDESAHALLSLSGHSGPIQDIAISSDGHFLLTGSWDKTLRLWDLNTGKTVRKFNGHTKDVLAVAFSPDNRQIVSGGRDKSIKLWNTIAECKFTITENAHTDWVTSLTFSPSGSPTIISASYDKLVKVWNLNNCRLQGNLVGHTGVINKTTISPDGTLCASGGRDNKTTLWDLQHYSPLYSVDAGAPIQCVDFSPANYWLAYADENSATVIDLETKLPIHHIAAERKTLKGPWCNAVIWSTDGGSLFAGTCEGSILRYDMISNAA